MSGSSEALPLSVAISAGGLAVLNPCSFPLLPVFLSASVASDGPLRPRSRFARGSIVGLTVAAGFVAVFGAIALPVSYGARVASDAIPWTGLGLSVVLVAAGAFTFLGRQPALRLFRRAGGDRRRGLRAMFAYGGGYGLASLGCSLPLFLSLVGATLGAGSTLLVLLAYFAGVTVVLTAFALATAFVHDELARATRRLLPHMHRLSGILLVVVGSYLAYYWARTEWGSSATLADDPLVGTVTRYTARLQTIAERHDLALVVSAATVVALAGLGGVAGWYRRRARSALRGRPLRGSAK